MSLAPVHRAAPDLTLEASGGREARLSDAWADGPAVIVFLRHFG